MKTVMANANTVEREWLIVDATNIPVGRLASQVAAILRGKNKPIYTPHVDTGDYVIVVNTDKMVLTGNKLKDKIYYRHSGYPGGLKEVQAKDLFEKRSDYMFKKAVAGMLPKNSLGKKMIKKLKVYKESSHPHSAQTPKLITLKGAR